MRAIGVLTAGSSPGVTRQMLYFRCGIQEGSKNSHALFPLLSSTEDRMSAHQ